MSRLVDPTLCPDCRATPRRVGHLHRPAGSRLTGSLAADLWRRDGRRRPDRRAAPRPLRPARPGRPPRRPRRHRPPRHCRRSRPGPPRRRAHGGSGGVGARGAAVAGRALPARGRGRLRRGHLEPARPHRSHARAARGHRRCWRSSPSCSPARTCAEPPRPSGSSSPGCSPSTCSGAQSAGLAGLDALDWRGTGALVGVALLALGLGVAAWALGQRGRPAVRRRGGRRGRSPRALRSTNVWLAENPAVACTIAVPVLAVLFVAAAAPAPRRGVRHGRAGAGLLAGLLARGLGPRPGDSRPRRVVVRRPRLAPARAAAVSPPWPCTCRRCPRWHARSPPASRCFALVLLANAPETLRHRDPRPGRRERHPARAGAARGRSRRAPGPWGPRRSPGSACSASAWCWRSHPWDDAHPCSDPDGSSAIDAHARAPPTPVAAAWTSWPASARRGRRDPRPAPPSGARPAPGRRRPVSSVPWPRRSLALGGLVLVLRPRAARCGPASLAAAARDGHRSRCRLVGARRRRRRAGPAVSTTAYLAGLTLYTGRRQRPADRHRHVGLLRGPRRRLRPARAGRQRRSSAAVSGGARRPGRRLGSGGVGGPGRRGRRRARDRPGRLRRARGSARRTGHASRDAARDPRGDRAGARCRSPRLCRRDERTSRDGSDHRRQRDLPGRGGQPRPRPARLARRRGARASPPSSGWPSTSRLPSSTPSPPPRCSSRPAPGGCGPTRRPTASLVLGSGLTLALLPSLLLALDEPVSLRGALIGAAGVAGARVRACSSGSRHRSCSAP